MNKEELQEMATEALKISEKAFKENEWTIGTDVRKCITIFAIEIFKSLRGGGILE